MKTTYNTLVMIFFGCSVVTHSLSICSSNEQGTQEKGKPYCPDMRCWAYAQDCKDHKAVLTVCLPAPKLRRCWSDLHERMPDGMRCLAPHCSRARYQNRRGTGPKGSGATHTRLTEAPFDTDYLGS